MATISKQEIILPNGKRFFRVIKYFPEKGRGYDRRTAHFSIELPEDVKIFHGSPSAVGSTDTEALTKFKSILEEFVKVKSKVEKVLVIKFEAKGAKEHKKQANGHFSSSNFNEYELSFSWGVYEKTSIGEKTSFEFLKIGLENLTSWQLMQFASGKNFSTEIKQMPWTEQRQNWCEDLEKAFQNMLTKVADFMEKNNSETFAKLIDKGSANLLPSPTA